MRCVHRRDPAIADIGEPGEHRRQPAAGPLGLLLEVTVRTVEKRGRGEVLFEGDRAHPVRAPLKWLRTTRSASCKARALAVRFDNRLNREPCDLRATLVFFVLKNLTQRTRRFSPRARRIMDWGLVADAGQERLWRSAARNYILGACLCRAYRSRWLMRRPRPIHARRGSEAAMPNPVTLEFLAQQHAQILSELAVHAPNTPTCGPT